MKCLTDGMRFSWFSLFAVASRGSRISSLLASVTSFHSQEGRFVILWLDGTTSKCLPHEVFSSMKDYDYQYDEEDDYWEGEDETVHYVSHLLSHVEDFAL